jgi:uncharacterized membrane protein YccC
VNTPLESELVARLREVVRSETPSELELRTLGEQAEGRARVLRGQIESSERRLQELDADPTSALSEIAAELRRLDALRAEAGALGTAVSQLNERSRALRTERLSRWVSSSP